MASKLQNMYIQLGISPKAAKLLIRVQVLDNPDRLRILADKNADNIFNVMRKLGGKNANVTPNRGQQVSAIAGEPEACSLPIPLSVKMHLWLGDNMSEQKTVHFLVGQKNLKE